MQEQTYNYNYNKYYNIFLIFNFIEEKSSRIDDNEGAFEEKLSVFKNTTRFAMKEYRDIGRLRTVCQSLGDEGIYSKV